MAQQYNNQRDHSRGGGGRPPAQNLPVTFYLDAAKENLNPTLLHEDAEKQALSLPEGRQKLTKSQIRRFFHEVKNLGLRLEQGRPWTQVEPLFRMLRSKAAYASGTNKVPREFSAFIADNVERVKDEHDFKAFILYFEAVVGYADGHNKIGGN